MVHEKTIDFFTVDNSNSHNSFCSGLQQHYDEWYDFLYRYMEPSFSSHPDTIGLNPQAGSIDTLFISSNKSWAFLTEGLNWFDFTPRNGEGNGEVIFTSLIENSDPADRLTTLSLHHTNIEKTIVVRQLHPSGSLTFDPGIITLPSDSGSADTMYITTNLNWKIRQSGNPDWVDFSPFQSTGSGMVIFTSKSKNADTASHVAGFWIESPAGNKDFYVRQSGKISGLYDKKNIRFMIFPYPIKDHPTFSLQGSMPSGAKHLVISDLTGRDVFQNTFTSESILFHRGNLASGVYVLKIFSDTGIILVQQKIVID